MELENSSERAVLRIQIFIGHFGANFSFTNKGISQDTYWSGVAAYHALLPPIVDAGTISGASITHSSFAVAPLTAPGISKEQLTKLLQPLFTKLQKLGIKITSNIVQFPGYLNQYTAMQSTIQVCVAQYGGRLIPRSVVEKNNDGLTAVIREIDDEGASVITIALNVSKKVAGDVYNAVLPAWRDNLISVVVST